jgi:hypothetical protein
MDRAIRLILFCVLAPLTLLAGDVWKDKPYNSWNEKEVRKILTSSPWAKQLLIAYYPQHGSGNHVEVDPNIQVGRVPVDPTRSGQLKPDAQSDTWQPKSIYVLRWGSSRTIRRALERQTVLRGGTPRQPRSEELDSATADYELTLSSQSTITEWPTLEASDWQARAYLETKRNPHKVLAISVEIRRGIQAEDGPTVIFRFPKKLANGEPLIAPGETGVEFFTQVGPRIFRATFNPVLMMARDGLDL